jgi:membrane associated rhomboid family serine protease
LLLNIALYFLSISGAIGKVDKFYLCPHDIVQGHSSLFQLLTAPFLHLSLGHLTANMVCLSLAGAPAERALGTARAAAHLAAALLLAGACHVSVAVALSAAAATPGLLSALARLLSRGGGGAAAGQTGPGAVALSEERLRAQCDLRTRHAGFSGVLFALLSAQAPHPPPFPAPC